MPTSFTVGADRPTALHQDANRVRGRYHLETWRYGAQSGRSIRMQSRGLLRGPRKSRKRQAAEALRRLSREAAQAERAILGPLRARIRHQIKKHRRRGNLMWRLRSAVKTGRKLPGLLEGFGYTTEVLRQHIERQFSKGMSWDRFASGDIHIDHVVPVCSFDLSKDDEVKACWSLTNLRPLWGRENEAKGGKRTLLL